MKQWLIGLGVGMALVSCAPVLVHAPSTTVQGATSEKQERYQTLVFAGWGEGTFTRAEYRMVLVERLSDHQIRGVFYNLSAGNNYTVTGEAMPSATAVDYNLTLFQGGNAGTWFRSKATVLGKEHQLFSVGWDAGSEAKAQLTGVVRDRQFTGRLKVVLNNYQVTLQQEE